MDVATLSSRISPYILVMETTSTVLNSHLVLGQSAFENSQLANQYLIMAHNARVNGDEQSFEDYWNQAEKYSKLRDMSIQQLNDKEQMKAILIFTVILVAFVSCRSLDKGGQKDVRSENADTNFTVGKAIGEYVL